MKQHLMRRLLSLGLVLVLLLSLFPSTALALESGTEETQEATPATRATQTLSERAAALKAEIQALAAGGELNARVDLTGFAPTTDEGDPIYGLRGQYYVAYLQDDATAMVLDGSWADDSKVYKATENEYFAPLPSISVPIGDNSLDTTSLDEDIAFTLLPADIFKKIGRHVFAFANTTLSGSAKEIYQLGVGSGSKVDVTVRAYNAIYSSPRILTQRIAGSNEMELLYSTSDGDLFTLKTANTDATPSFGWVKATTGTTGTPFVLYHRWSTVGLRTAIKNALTLLNNPDSYVAAEYATFLDCLDKSIAVFNASNAFSGIIAPYVYPQEEMDRLTLELESYHTLLTKKNYIDIPVEIIDFRSDGYLFENTGNYSFRVDINDAELFYEEAANYSVGSEEYEDAKKVADDIVKKFTGFPELPGQVVQPVKITSEVANMRTGLTEKSLVNGNLVYDPQTITFMAHLMCKKASNASGSVTYYVPGLAKTLHEHIHNTFYLPYNKAGVTEEEQNIVMGSWDQTLAKIGGTNGNPITWSQVETAHDAAYYLLTYLWQPVPETDTFYNSEDPNTVDPSLVSQADNRYNKIVTERDTLRLYGDAKGVYTLDSWQKMGYSGRYSFNTDLSQTSGLKPKFAPIDGLGFEEPGVMNNLFDTDPASGRVVVEGYNGYDANYNLSMHAYGSFVYYEDQNLYFKFDGDDDVYFFIGGDLALDIGSSHANKKGECYLNNFVFQDGSKLVNGQTYTFDMFYTERATPDANLKFTTNIKIIDDKALTTKGQYLEQHGTESRVDSKTGFGVSLEENAMVAIGDTVAYSFELLNTRTVPLTDVSFTDDTLGVSISKDSLTLCDPTYTLTNGAKTQITDIIVAYRTYDASTGVNADPLTMVSYSSMLSQIREATAEPTGEATQFVQLDVGSYGVKISSEEELKTLLELGIPVNCQMIVYGFKRIMITTDQPYINLVQSLAHYKRVSVEGTGLVYGDPIPVSGTAERSLRVPDLSSITPPTAEAERYIIDYNKPVELSIEDITKHVYTNKLVAVGNIVGFVPEGSNGSILRRAPETLYCDGTTDGQTMDTSYGTVTRTGNTLTYQLNGFLSDIDRIYAVVAISGLVIQAGSEQEYNYPYILVEIQIIPATSVYYETDLAAQEFQNEDSNTASLLFHFKNDPLDQRRYSTQLYSGYNFDRSSKPHWAYGTTGASSIQLDPSDNGALVVNAKYGGTSLRFDTAPYGNQSVHPLKYRFTGNDVLIIRFKMENFTNVEGKTPYVSLHPYLDGSTGIVDAAKSKKDFDTSYLNSGEYNTVTVDLVEGIYSYDYLTRFRIYFGYVESLSEDQIGKLTVDYIYIGPEVNAPVEEHLYFDFADRETDRLRYGDEIYGSSNYNFDIGTWRSRTKTTNDPPEFDKEKGTISFTTLDQTTLAANGYSAYIQLGPYIQTNFPLQFNPANADKLLIRFKLENLQETGYVSSEDKTYNAQLRLNYYCYDTYDNNGDKKDDILEAGRVSLVNDQNCFTGEFVTLPVNINTVFRNQSRISTIRLTFAGISIADPTQGTGKITIDSIFIGREEDYERMEQIYGQTWQTVTDGTTHTGETQESDFVNRTVYDMEKCGEDQRLFIDFNNTTADQTRYGTVSTGSTVPTAYGKQNLDILGPWESFSRVASRNINHNSGFMELTAKSSLGNTEFPDIYQSVYNLNYDPSHAEVFQIRFKLKNFVLGVYDTTDENKNTVTKTFEKPYVDVHYNYDKDKNSWGRGSVNNWFKQFDIKYLDNDQFVTVTTELTDAFRNAGTIDSIRPYIAGLESVEGKDSGIAYIDYIYIGPRDRAPADTVYGYDASYDNDTGLSNGSSVYVEGAGLRLTGTETTYTETLFSFTGTGFDIISRTGADQGTIRVSVYSDPVVKNKDTLVKALTVNNKGELELNQIPVASLQGLPHGTYYVTIGVNKKITGSAIEALNRGNQFYFDAIRIYDPIDTTKDSDIYTVYKLDSEANAYIKEVRNILLSSEDFANLMGSSTEGAVFIDSYEKETGNVIDPETGETTATEDEDISINERYALTVQTYNKLGPKNEVYLHPGQAVAFRLQIDSSQIPASLDIGAKTINGTEAKLVVGIIASDKSMDTVLTVANRIEKEISSATGLYYPLTTSGSTISANRNYYIVVYNASDSSPDRTADHVLSITDIKAAYANTAAANLPQDDETDSEIAKRTTRTEAPISFLVDGNTAEAAAFFLRREMETPILDSDTKIYHSLNLASDISLNYLVPKSHLEGAQDFYLTCEVPLYEGNVQADSKTLTLQPTEKGDYYYFTLDGLTAVQMNDVIRATLYMTKDGQSYCSETDSYSIAQYAYGQLDRSGIPDSLKSLCADLLRYGAAAQTYKGYRTDSLAAAALTEEQKTYLTDLAAVTFGNTNVTLKDLENPSVTWAGKSLDLQSKVAVKYVFRADQYIGDLSNLSLHVSYTDLSGNVVNAVVTDLETYSAENRLYAFSFSGLLAAELRTVLSAQIYEGQTPVSATVQYSPDTYGNKQTGTLETLCKALMAYSDSAKAYFAN